MHETSIAKQIVERVLEYAAEAGAVRVIAVRGWVAETEQLQQAALAFHFDAHARGTPAAGAELQLALRHVHARCTACGTEYAPEHHLTLCPECGSTQATLSGPVGLGIDSISVE
jgi:hydrogenase nickel incorporation protein HypA/HybF